MSKHYCDKCYDEILKKENQIYERFMSLQMYLYQLLMDRRLTYSQWCCLKSILSKDREWALHAHYQQSRLYRPPDWRAVEMDNDIPPESDLRT